MAIKKSEKKRIKLDAKKIGRILCFALLTIALLIGIIFSSVKVNMDMIYGPEYNGAYQASVQVIDKNGKTISTDEMAQSLSDKLAPFSDKSITVTKTGKDHLTVIVGKQDYENNETYLRNQIQSNGGLFMLNQKQDPNTKKTEFGDWYMDGKQATSKNTRYNSSTFFNGSVSTKTLNNGAGRDPFVQIGLNDGSTKGKSALAEALEAETAKKTTNGAVQLDDTTGQPQYTNLYFASNLEEMVDTLRTFYNVTNDSSKIDVFYNDILKPMQDMYNSLGNSTDNYNQKEVLRSLFGGTVSWYPVGGPSSTIKQSTKVSLLDDNFGTNIIINGDGKNPVTGIHNEQDLERILDNDIFTANTSDMPTSKFLYNADATYKEISDSSFTDWMTGSKLSGVTKQKTFEWTINAFMNDKILLGNGTDPKNQGYKFKQGDITPRINPDLTRLAPQLANNILYAGPVSPSTTDDHISTDITGEVQSKMSFIVDNASHLDKQDASRLHNDFYLRTRNLTSAKEAVASIKQNALGVSYLVESITGVNPYITSVLYVVSVVFLSIIALLLAIYILFVYRLLGLFTIIIAACSVAIVLLAASGFGIGMGPQVIAALFLIIGLIMDTSFILFESWKENYYENKHGIMSSFKIGNRQTLSMAVDGILVAFIPNIVLFWAATGPLKTFGTLSIIGVGLAVVCGIIIGRFIYWLILRAKFIQKTDWLLPMDTRYSSLQTLRDEFAINKYTNFLENHEGKTNYTTKELEQISKAKQNLEVAQKSYQKNLVINNQKVTARDERTLKWVNKSHEFLTKMKAWVIKAFRIRKPEKNGLVRLIDGRIEDDQNVINIDKEVESTDSTSKSKLRNKGKIVRSDRMVTRGMFFLIIGLVIIGIAAAIVGGITGVRWANNVGYSQQFVLYGDQTFDTIHDKLGGTGFSLSKEQEAKWNSIKNDYENNPNNKSGYVSTTEEYAYELRDMFEYFNDTDAWKHMSPTGTSKNINLRKAKFEVISNYQHVDSKGEAQVKDLIALRISSTATSKASRSAFKRVLVQMEGQNAGDPGIMNDSRPYDGDNYGIEAYDISPYTVSKQIRNVGIAFGIALAILVAYIFIRFKWTYYVALALGLGLVIGTVVALITICRVPMSTELLCGMVYVITFALTTMILVLGKGKSKLNLDDKKNVEDNFSPSIKLSADMRHQKAQGQSIYLPMRKKLKHLWWQIVKLKWARLIRRNTFDQYEELDKLIEQHGQLKNDYKAAYKEQSGIYKEFKDKSKRKQNELQRKNWYFKELFNTLIKYSTWRMVTLGAFYLLVGIILAATLPTIFGMGLTIVFGIIAGFSIALFFSVPVWVYFEKRRIRYVYGRKKYIESLKVSREEETVKGIND